MRTGEITNVQAEITLTLFEIDFPKYSFIATDSLVLEQARRLTTKYGAAGLRTLDSIQLATCLVLAEEATLFLTADKLLKTLIAAEGLPTEMTGREPE